MIVHTREPLLHATPIVELRPTQITVGMREVQAKRKSWRDRERKEYDSFLAAHMVPAIVGPGGLRYLIDHHHLALALHKEGVESVFISVVADLGNVDPDFFWNLMDFHGWTHPFDAKGRRRDYDALPKTVDKLKDDPYRSLAGELRNLGGFAKDSQPFAEFVWADFLRKRIDGKKLEGDFDAALAVALDLARSPEANYLPGWCASRTKKAK
jgi:hypothetical protein